MFYRYSWCSDRLVNNSEIPKFNRLENLIPLEAKPHECELTKLEPKMIIGHNVAYDRTRVREQYYQKVVFFKFF